MAEEHRPGQEIAKMIEQTCDECGKDFEAQMMCKFCSNCADELAMQNLAQLDPPEGGWPRGSDMDRL